MKIETGLPLGGGLCGHRGITASGHHGFGASRFGVKRAWDFVASSFSSCLVTGLIAIGQTTFIRWSRFLGW